MDRGELVSDELVIALVAERTSQDDAQKGFLLDGFPRTIAQAEALDEALSESGRKIDRVISLEVSGDELIRRLTGRRVCPSCGSAFHMSFNKPEVDGVCDACSRELIQRSDDSEDVVRNRLDVYSRQTEPLVGFYLEKGILLVVDGEKGIDDVTAQIEGSIRVRT